MKRKFLLAALSLMLCVGFAGAALAETTFDGTVVSGESVGVTAPFGGTVSSFRLREGDEINPGDVIAEVRTTKVYASVDGVVTGVFGQPGDAVDDVVNRVGAVLYIEPDHKYTITADIQKAYSNSDTKYVNIGETVFIRSYYSSNGNTAVGVVTAADGTAYTVETTSGELLMEEDVYIYRSPDYDATSRIGKGTVSRTAEVAVGASGGTASGSGSSAGGSTGSDGGSILYMHVRDGDTVARGQLLYETVTGTLDGLYATGNQIVSDVSGIVASVNVSVGGTVGKGDTLLTVYPRDKMQVVIEIDEYDLADIHEGDTLRLEFNYDDSADSIYTGTVAMISHVSVSTGTSEVAYKAYVDFTPSKDIRLGMSVLASVAGDEEEAAQPESGDGAAQQETDVPQAGAPVTPTEDVAEGLGE